MGNIVIVGGGIAGLVAALTLKGRHNITLVEKAAECGGLMRSFVNGAGIAYDYGTHVLSDTGNDVVDALLFDRIRDGSWRRFHALNTGSYFAGALYDQSPHVNLRSLPKDLYEHAIKELLAPPSPSTEVPLNFVEQMRREFGSTVTDSVQRPAMRKIFECELEELLPDNPFFLRRFVAFDAEKSRGLKKNPLLDAKLAFASYEDGAPAVQSYYPKRGGVGQWVQNICAELGRSGVNFSTSQGIARIGHDSGVVNSVTLENGMHLPCDILLWSAPPFLLLKAMGFDTPTAPLKTRPMSFFHFCFDRPFQCKNYYVTNYDEAFTTFRVTLYPNLQQCSYDGVHHCTVEVIGNGITAALQDKIAAELATMGVTTPDAKVITCDFDCIPFGFPTLTREFLDAAQQQVEMVRQGTRRVELLGRAKHDAFSMQSVALEAHRRASLFI